VSSTAQFPYLYRGGSGVVSDLAPLLPIRLDRDRVSLDVVALVDSGATISVLPWSVGLRFGVDWDSLNVPCPIGGGAGSIPGKVLIVYGTVPPFPTVPLVFSWVQSDNVRIILGQTNFFLNFDVFFFRAQSYFEIQPATAPTP
jgi:hypothetical protein